MRIFLTAATGYVGSAVADALLRAGHGVGALARSAESARRLAERGILPFPGNLREPSTYADVAAAHEAIVHTAFEYDAHGNEVRETDEAAVDSLLSAAASGSELRHLIYTSSAFLLGGVRADPITEWTPTDGAHAGGAWRRRVERRVLEAAGDSLRTAVVRLGVVYGGNSYSMSEFFSCARREERVVYHGDGTDRWPLVHRGDAAALYLRILESRAAGVFHAVDGFPMPVARIAELASRAAGCAGRTRGIPRATYREIGGEHVDRIAHDVPVVATRSREIGWRPHIRSFEEGAEIAYREWSELHPLD